MNYSTIRLYDYGHDMEREGGKARLYIGKLGLGGEVSPDVNDYDYSSGCYIYCFSLFRGKRKPLLAKDVNSRAF